MSQTFQQVPDDQLTPKEVVQKLVDIKDALLKNWKALLIVPLLGFGIGYALDIYLKEPDTFDAEVVFNLGGGNQNSGLGDLSGLLGLGSTPDANIFTGENFFYFVKSRPVLERNLMKEVDVKGKKMILANYYIETSGIIDDEWEERPEIHKFRFKENDPLKMDMESRRILNELVKKVADQTEIANLDRKSSFISLSANMQDETLTGLWITNLLETVEELYTENQTQKTRKTLNLLQHRADSLASVLGITEHKLARQMDYSQQIILPEAQIQTKSIERKSSFLQSLYYEAIGSAEKMRVSLVREAPLFTKIEDIKTPLDRRLQTKTRAKIGALAGLLVAFIFIYFRTIFATVPKKA